jgi:P-type Cu+ transporter
MRSDLLDVVAALDLSLSIFSVIKRNLVWACLYNVLGIPLAMGIFLPWGWGLHPMTAAASMAFSSVSVVMSSLTLKWWRRPASSLMPGIAAPIEGQGMRESARGVVTDVRDTIRSLIPFGKSKAPSREGYDQLPMEAI